MCSIIELAMLGTFYHGIKNNIETINYATIQKDFRLISCPFATGYVCIHVLWIVMILPPNQVLRHTVSICGTSRSGRHIYEVSKLISRAQILHYSNMLRSISLYRYYHILINKSLRHSGKCFWFIYRNVFTCLGGMSDHRVLYLWSDWVCWE